MRIAVVGAGWAGLAAAVELVRRGAQVTLFEAGRHPGGRARSIQLADADGQAFTADNGQHLLVGAYAATLSLMRQVGVDPETALLRLPLTVDVPGHFRLALPLLPAPWHTAVGLLAAHGASLREKWAAARFMQRLQANGFRLADDGPVSAWLDTEGQHGALRRFLWEPLCLAALNTPPAAASAQVFANVLRDTLGGPRAATDLLLPRQELGAVLPTPACRWLREQGAELRFGQRVRTLVAAGDTWQLLVDAAAPEARTDRFERVLLAVGPQHAAALLPAGPAFAGLRETLATLTYEPIATIYLAYGPNVRLPLPLLGLAGPLGQWVFDRGQLGGPPGLLAVVLSGHGDWEALDNPTLAQRLHGELGRALSHLPQRPPLATPRSSHIIREQRATFACRPNLPRVAHATPDAGLWLAGDHTRGDYPATLEGAVRSGRAAARALLASGGLEE